ncbi:hypothetical protein SteCoe_29308 [Stentor coeruleus]|uniref:Uncharacterized protein n=1 Tax=Stentor coeruleus TaxID=5963 RepID=A0A1R2B6A6_9CILI|nr:hypothetical protein SteCoe_29308 [Stentor coeruleus]
MQVDNAKHSLQVPCHPELVYCSYFLQSDSSLHLALNIGILKAIIYYRNLPEGIEIKGIYENYLQKIMSSACLLVKQEITVFIDHYNYMMSLKSQIEAFFYINKLFISEIQMYSCIIKTFEKIICECYLKTNSAIEENKLLLILSKVFKVAFSIIKIKSGKKVCIYDQVLTRCPSVILYKSEKINYGLLYTAEMCEFELNPSGFESTLHRSPLLFIKNFQRKENILNKTLNKINTSCPNEESKKHLSMQNFFGQKTLNTKSLSSAYKTVIIQKEARTSISKPQPLNLIKKSNKIIIDDSNESFNTVNKNPDSSSTCEYPNNQFHKANIYNSLNTNNQLLSESSYRNENTYSPFTTLDPQDYKNISITVNNTQSLPQESIIINPKIEERQSIIIEEHKENTYNLIPNLDYQDHKNISITVTDNQSLPKEPININPKIEESQSIIIEEHKENTLIISEENGTQKKMPRYIFEDNAPVLTCCESGCDKFSKYFCTCTGSYNGFCSKHMKMHSKKGRIFHPRINNFTEIDKNSKHQIINLCEKKLKSINKTKKNILEITHEKEKQLFILCKNDLKILETKKKVLKEARNYVMGHNKIMFKEKYNEAEDFMLDCIDSENGMGEVCYENELGNDILTMRNEDPKKYMLELIEAMGHVILNSEVRQESLAWVIKKVMEKDSLAESEVLKRLIE